MATAELTCTVCLEPFTEPKVLPCCHTFCKKCLEGILEKKEEREKLACPQCRAEHDVPEKGIEAFLTDYTIKSNSTQASEETATPTCGLCDQHGTATSHCQECEEYLCECCSSSHTSTENFQSHTVESVNSDEFAPPPAKKAKLTATFCCDHPDKSLDLYCKTCQLVVCELCLSSLHEGHEQYEIGGDIRREVQYQIEKMANDAETKLTCFENDLASISELEKDKAKEPLQLKDEINKSFDALVATIEARRAALLEQVETSTNKDLKEIWAQKDIIETTVAASQSAISFASRSFQCKNDREFLLLGSQLKSRFKQIEEKEWNKEPIEGMRTMSKELAYPVTPSPIGWIKRVTTRNTDPVPDAPHKIGKKSFVNSDHRNDRENYVDVAYQHGKKKVKFNKCTTKKPFHYLARCKCDVMLQPVVSGEHVITLESRKNSKEGRILGSTEHHVTVTGMPEIGATIEHGPDWDHQNEDINAEKGTVTHRIVSDEDDTYGWVRVKWFSGETREYKWGADGCYEVQLVFSQYFGQNVLDSDSD